MSATLEGGFVVFLIGMRINNPFKVHKWLPVAAAMPRMLRELDRRPELGLLHAETYAVSAGSHENIYVNMPLFGLGKAGTV